MQYGFQRLVLLGSAGYSRAELPLDGAVSLVAPNNTGKTGLINALQFLLIIDQRRMDFGAHDVDKSRRFYFPNNSAYVLLEVSLPESGTVVLGCVGKGVSFEYEYFAYAGPLKIEEFCLPDGKIVAQPQLASHLATHGRRVFSYNSSEFANMVYGGRSRKLASQQDFCVFRLEHAGDASVFQRVLTRTLRLDKLRSSEVKDYLMQIFRRDLPDASIDFKAEWDKAFADLNAERSQYLAAVRLQLPLSELEQKQDARLALRGKLLCWRPLIDEALGQWQQYYEARQQALQHELAQCDLELQHLREQDIQSAREQNQYELEQRDLRQQCEQLHALQQRFALIADRAVLEARRRELQEQRDALVVRIGQAQSRTPAAIERDLSRTQRELAQLAQELRTQGQNLYQQLAGVLSAGQINALNRVLAKPVLTMGTEDFRLDGKALSAALVHADAAQLNLPGLQLRLEALPAQYQQRTLAELGELQQELQQQQTQLQEQLATAQALGSVKQQREALDQQLAELDAELRDYAHMQNLRQSETARQGRLEALAKTLAELAASLAQSAERNRALDQQRQQRRQDLATLQQQHRLIELRRNQRLDHGGPFTWLADLPHHPWLAQPEFALEQLAERLQTYLADCRELLDLDEQIRHLLGEIHTGGLTKYQFVGEPESEIVRLVEFAHHLQQEAEALEKKVRSAVVNVAASLRELRDGLFAFKRRMREFNRKISGRQLSDLAVFKIEPEDETTLVEAIELLINTAATVDSGETFELFNQQSVLDDDQINRAKTLLIEEGNARHGLRVADLFRLRFWVGKADREPEAFDDLDSAASNGTVLMAKLITGLAMLHLMQDQRRHIQGVCYLDEALALDARNQRSLIDTAAEFGFSLIFASPAPLTTVRYCVPIHHRHGSNQISRFSWQIIEPVDA
ncbi:hypothetical protein [Acidithiobacillus ferridurans]|uniref:Chromosome partition protein Smc n=2 Tax=Acidithiobacillus ferridurans TaxID=1232575 RepID=A0A8X8GCP1_ACIFI|nr:hypothetical protein [Acidithiobacillus ferridurans]MBU2716642.1 hypothetical protein [Acidithiobacillus ferridurans]MBU2724197.1 hypothetical protein [Acidithiobacillus ferridurans]MBU2725172.1 hypothetical protein [Acidithiobacillus ferridurans]BBF66452.1 hypothetical protein AFERRID_26700 [Acidithiobacillus ferridurans]